MNHSVLYYIPFWLVQKKSINTCVLLHRNDIGTHNARHKIQQNPTVRKYMEFLEMLGEGGFGRVLCCRDVEAN
jgi:hypothetical protein